MLDLNLLHQYKKLDTSEIRMIKDLCKHTYEKCKPHFTNTRTALDIGSKKGAFARYICEDFSHVHMFDMRPKTQWKLVDRSKCTLHTVAVGNKNKDITFYGPITETQDENYPPNQAKMITIDSLDLNDVDFIKIDVEGDEKSVLQGAINTIKKHKPVIVLEQNHTTEKYKKGKYGEAIEWLQNENYKIVDYNGVDDWILKLK